MWAAAFLMLMALAAAGSATPFDFRPLPVSRAVHLFLHLEFAPLGRIPATDMVGNMLLFLPIGFSLAAALDDRRVLAVGTRTLTALGAIAAAAGLSAATEFGQVFLPSRFVAGSDILAETIGAAIGVTAWIGVGRRLTVRVERTLAGREPAGLLVRLLAAYALAFFVVQIYPFDVTISPAELAEKYRLGRVDWNVLGVIHGQNAVRPFVMTLLGVPLGLLAALGWPPRASTRDVFTAMVIGLVVVGFAEASQLFIYSRATSAADLLALSAGVAAGVVAASRLVTSLS